MNELSDQPNSIPEIKDILGIGPTKVKQLKDAGIFSIHELAAENAYELATLINSSNDIAASYIVGAQKLLRDGGFMDQEFVTAKDVLERRKKEIKYLSTGSIILDKFFKGGIETEAITELYGKFGSGKSQVCHTCAALASLPIEQGGLNTNVLYLDTEGTFRPERLEQIATARGLDVAKVMASVVTCKIYNSSHFELIMKELGRWIEKYQAKLVIVDSIISHHRADMIGRGNLQDKQSKLNSIVHKLNRIAEIYHIAILITNQVVSDPTVFYGDPTKAAGGNVIGHASTYRVYLKVSGKTRTATMIDSPYHEWGNISFEVTEKGVTDTEEELKKMEKQDAKAEREALKAVNEEVKKEDKKDVK